MAGFENISTKDNFDNERSETTRLFSDPLHRHLLYQSKDITATTPPDSTTPANGTPSGQWRPPYGGLAPGVTNGAGTRDNQPVTPKDQPPTTSGATDGNAQPPKDQTPPKDTPPPVAQGPAQPAVPEVTTTPNVPHTPDPNQNGDQPTGPKWQPKPSTPGWDNPGPAQTPTDQPAGNNGKGDNLYDPHRPDIDHGLQRQIGFPGQMFIGGISGAAFGGPISYTLNRTVESLLVNPEQRAAARESGAIISNTGTLGRYLPQEARDAINQAGARIQDGLSVNPDSTAGRAAKWWQDKFDPRYFHRNELESQQEQFATKSREVGELIERTEQRISDLQHTDGQTLSQAQELELRQLNHKLEILRDPEWVNNSGERLNRFNANNLEQPGLFTAEEQSLIRNREIARTKINELESSAVGELKMWGENPKANFIRGATFVGMTMVADHYLDRLFNHRDHKDGLTDSSLTESLPLVGGMTKSWHTNSLLVPLAFSSGGWTGKGLLSKIGYTGAALVAGKVLDKILPAGEHEGYSRLMTPTGVESIAMAGAFCIPTSSNWVRAGLIGAAWLTGRIENSVEKPAKIDLKNESYSKLEDDMKTRSADSMNASINSFKGLGERDDQALRILASEWLRPNRQYDGTDNGALSKYRGTAVLYTALGESRLDKGTLIPNSQKDFMLGGKDLDIGAEATRALLIAKNGVEQAKAQTQKEMGQSEKGKTVTDQEIKDLDKIKERIDSDLQQKVYGKHDIKGAIDELSDRFKSNPTSYKLQMSLDEAIRGNQNSPNKAFVAKLYRDEACIFLSVAKYKAADGNTTEAQAFLYGTSDGRQAHGYDGAFDVIERAKQLDPNNPDIQQLDQIANELKQRIPKPGA